MAEFSAAVMEETLKKQVAEAWSRRTPFRHGNLVLWTGSRRASSGGLWKPCLSSRALGTGPQERFLEKVTMAISKRGLLPPYIPSSVWF